METKTLIIHGWSDCSKSFKNLKNFLCNQQVGDISNIYFTDYDSREDSLTFNDVADGLHGQLVKKKLVNYNGSSPYKFNIIVHSTGGLVVRHWIWRYYYKEGMIEDCPVKKIIMLAPANFGSPLAHRGKSLLGSFLKGKYELRNFLEVGRKILSGLELGSAYQWQMAHRDLLLDQPYFNSENIQLTILIGAKDYSGIRGIVNKPGTDGTVVISGTNVNTAKLIIDCTKNPDENTYQPLLWKLGQGVSDYSFGVLDEYDHSSIVEKAHSDKKLQDLIVEALKIEDHASFKNYQKKLESITEKTYKNTSAPAVFQQFLVRAIDDHDEPVDDFTVEFFLRKAGGEVRYGLLEEKRKRGKARTKIEKTEDDFTYDLNELLTKEFHRYTVDGSYRRFLVNLNAVEQLITNAKSALGEIILSMKIHVPQVDRRIRYAVSQLQNIVFYDSRNEDFHKNTFFFPNTTTLLELQVNRENDCVVVSL